MGDLMNRCRSVFAVSLSSLILCAPAAFSAEIININYKYRIAFTDLTQADVKPEDKVTVLNAEGKELVLKVLEAYPVMAKLTVPHDADFSDKDFSQIMVGSKVTAFGYKVPKPAPAAPASQLPSSGAVVEDAPSNIEVYTPPGSVKLEVQVEPKPETRKAVKAESAQPVEVKPPVVTFQEPVREANPPSVVLPPQESLIKRISQLEDRLDQATANNIKLADSISGVLAEKTQALAELKTRDAELSEARGKINELTTRNDGLLARVAALEKEKSTQQQEIDSLNVKLSELKKKLTKLVDIINTNRKAYENK